MIIIIILLFLKLFIFIIYYSYIIYYVATAIDYSCPSVELEWFWF